MKTMNVTAKHGYGAVHLGGREMANDRWSPACGTQHHNVGGREVTPLRPTEQAVTCKRCLKVIERDGEHETTRPEPEGSGIDWTDPNEKFYAFGSKPKPAPFTFEYDATEGVLIAAALREKAKAERELSKDLRVYHDGVGAAQADNRAGLLSLAADRIHKPVHAALVQDFDKALTKAEAKPMHAKLNKDIGLTW